MNPGGRGVTLLSLGVATAGHFESNSTESLLTATIGGSRRLLWQGVSCAPPTYVAMTSPTIVLGALVMRHRRILAIAPAEARATAAAPGAACVT
ncbi:MAG: hypothetical protein QOI48_273 [Solirubrobacteraceae bacterium]|jgi:hypothetical protein|nr:hypothetical protein [Solirubrobacteraceae bacterium]